jgi:hypothetical protein
MNSILIKIKLIMKANYSQTYQQNFLERKKDKYCVYKRCKNYKLRTKQMCRAHEKMIQKTNNTNFFILSFIFIITIISIITIITSIITYANFVNLDLYFYENVYMNFYENVYMNFYENVYMNFYENVYANVYEIAYNNMYKYVSNNILNQTYDTFDKVVV